MRRLVALLTGLVAILSHVTEINAACPWDDASLRKWSKPGTWPGGKIPRAGDAVVIPKGKKILLDAPIPRLLTLTVDGVLVWGNVDGIRLETSYILVNGEFHIGSEKCKLEKEADIFLYGKSNSSESHRYFGRKFIGATSGSILEIHGKEKKSWTKLISTVEKTKQEACGLIYDSRNGEPAQRVGIHLNVWSEYGISEDFKMYMTSVDRLIEKSVNELVDKLESIPKNKIVSLAVYRTIGTPSAKFHKLYSAVERLGGSQIRQVEKDEPYVFIATKGAPKTAVEHLVKAHKDTGSGIEARASLQLGKLVFMTNSFTWAKMRRGETLFRVMTREFAFPKLSLLHDVTSWRPGDEVVVASTDFDWRQTEVRTIVSCKDCKKNQIQVDGDFRYTHFGEVTYGVDERAEVGLLSRNIRIEAELQSDCYFFNKHEEDLCRKFNRDTFGGHVQILREAKARIEGAQLTSMGQQALLAKYPLHFHMCDGVPGQYLRNNVIRDSNSRCITIHGTDYLEVSDNVCLNHHGHGIFLEDSAEQNNTIHRNLVIGTQHGTLLLTDKYEGWCEGKTREFCNLLSSIWITHPNNYFTENVAAGSDGFGVVFAFSDRPLGPSLGRQMARGLYRDMSTRYIKVPLFDKNVMHSNALGGLWFDNRLSYGQKDGRTFVPPNGKLGLNLYSPRHPPTPEGRLVETVLSQLTFYKNQDRNVWLRCGNIVITNSTFADSPTSYVAAHTISKTYCDVRNSVFIGETANKGEPLFHIFHRQFPNLPKYKRPKHQFDRSFSENRPDFMINGVTFYQGPVYLDNCYFDRYFNWYYNDTLASSSNFRPVRPAAAITFHPNNHYPSIPRNGVKNLKFGFCDGKDNAFRVMNGNASTPFWNVFDGTIKATIRDYDGSLTGLPNTQIVQDRPFFTGTECLKKPDWGLSVCPYTYFLLVIRGKTGVLQRKYRGKSPVFLSRDEQPEDTFIQKGTNGHKVNLRTFQSYTIRFNPRVGKPPRDIKVRPLFGLQKNETVRLALCLPKSTTSFGIYSKYPVLKDRVANPIWVTSLAELDQDTTMKAFFWDKANGYLYFKMSSPYLLTRKGQECPGDQCLEVTVVRKDGGDEPAVCTSRVPPYKPKIRWPRQLREPTCRKRDTAKGLGAPIESGFHAPPKDSGKCHSQAPTIAALTPAQTRGCFSEMLERNDFDDISLTLKYSMTPELCINRCRIRNFAFAGLHSGSVCRCANNIGRNGASKACTTRCSGDKGLICGGGRKYYSVFTTGVALPAPPKRCGHQYRGVVYENACVYVNHAKEDFFSADKRCQRQGGSLVKIDSESKQRFIEAYLQDTKTDVWIGVSAEENKWVYQDGTVLGRNNYGKWRTSRYLTPRNNKHLFLQSRRGFQWNTSPPMRDRMGLCDLPLQGQYTAGLQASPVCKSGICLIKLDEPLPFEQSQLACKIKYGRMASVGAGTSTEKTVLEYYLNEVVPDRKMFWVAGSPTERGKQKAYTRKARRRVMSFSQYSTYQTVCVVEKSSNGCPNTNWVFSNGNCYLVTNTSTYSFYVADALCNGDGTSLLTIESQKERDFIKKLLGSETVWIDLRYNSFLDAITTSSGVAPAFTPWSPSETPLILSKGLCVTANMSDGLWRHTNCRSRTRRSVVCKAKASQ